MKKIFIILLFIYNTAFAQIRRDTVCIKCKDVVIESVAVGVKSFAGFSTTYDNTASSNGDEVAIGYNTQTHSWRGTMVGANSIGGATSVTGYGYGVFINVVHGVGIGRGQYMPKLPDNIYNGIGKTGIAPIAIGAPNATDFGIGIWWGNYFRYSPGMSAPLATTIPSQITLTYHGQDAYADSIDGTHLNQDGGHIGIAAGRGTGTGKSGEIRFYTAPSVATNGNVKNPLVLGPKITANGSVPTKFTNIQMLALTNVEEGTEIYNTTLHCPCFFNGVSWQCATSQFQ